LGENGIALFIKHVPSYLGATEVLIKLLQTDDSQQMTTLNSVSFLDTLIEVAIQQSNNVQNITEMGMTVKNPTDFNFNCFKLLGALCKDSSYSKKITERLFNVNKENCMIQMEMEKEGKKKVRVKLGNDIWRELDDFMVSPPFHLHFIDHLLELVYLLSIDTHTTNVQLTSKCVTRDVCFYNMKNKKLPSRLRSRFCDILKGKIKLFWRNDMSIY
jgi:hypothetical protein